MKKLSLFLALLLVFTALSPCVLADDTYYYRTNVANGAPLRITYAKTGSSYLRYYTIDGGSDSSLSPMVVFGDKLYGTLSIKSAVKYVEEAGYYPMAAFNSDFFSMSTGVPTGMNVVDGRLCSSGADWNCLAFNADGTAFCGAPRLKLTIDIAGITYPLAGINKMRTAGGIYLFTEDFAASTKTVYEGCEAVLTAVAGKKLTLNQPFSLFVDKVADACDTTIPKGGYVISVTKSSEDYYDIIKGLWSGAQIVVKAVCDDTRWAKAKYITGGGNMLAQDGKLIEENVSSSSADPRTVVGVKSDGSYRVLVCDGRLSGVSNGLSFKNAAELLIKDGYTDVINLDGGGSSQMLVRKPGREELEMINIPSEGTARSCAVYVVFVNNAERTGKPFGSATYAESDNLLAGASVAVSTAYFDKNYYPVKGFEVTGGTLSENTVFTAPDSSQTVKITPVSSLSKVEGLTINVYDDPDTIKLYSDGKAISEITCEAGDAFDIDVKAYKNGVELWCDDSQFKFEVTGNVGTVDEKGAFKASSENGISGAVTVSFNGTKKELPVTINKIILPRDVTFDEYSFEDIKGHWAANNIEYLCREGVFSKDKLFNPQGTLTNAMTVTLVSRFLKLDTAEFADTELPYKDKDDIPSWAAPHVKAAYSLGLLSEAFSGESFSPDEPATRACVMTMLSLTINDNGASYGKAAFSDYAEAPVWAAPHIDKLYALGIVTGYAGTDEVKPLGNITRAETAALMIRLYK